MEDTTQALATQEPSAPAVSGDGTSQAVAAPGTQRTSFTEKEVNLVKRTICQGATDEELSLFLQQCRRTGLDPFSNQIHAVFRWDSREKREVMQIQTGIDGYRLIAERTGLYDGQGPVEWCGNDGRWRDVWLSYNASGAARVTIFRSDFSRPISAVALYDEYVATKKGGDPNYMWDKMPANMLAKCAEALAIRKAFPKDTSGVYTKEEMQQAGNAQQPQSRTREREAQREEVEAEATAHPRDAAPHSAGRTPQPEDAISPGQRRRLFAIAKNEGGYTDQGIRRLIGAHGYESTKDIAPEDYDAIIEDAYLPGEAQKHNADPSQTDAFEQAADEAEAGAAEGGAGKLDLDAFGADLREAAEGYDTPEAKRGAVNRVAKAFAGERSSASQEEQDAINRAYQEVLDEIAPKAEAPPSGYDPEAPPALSKEDVAGDAAPRTELPEDFSQRDRLEEAGITTAEGVLSAGSIDGLPALTDIDGIGEAREEDLREAAEALLE